MTRTPVVLGLVGCAIGLAAVPLAVAFIGLLYILVTGNIPIRDYPDSTTPYPIPIGPFVGTPGFFAVTLASPVIGIIGAVASQNRSKLGGTLMLGSGTLPLLFLLSIAFYFHPALTPLEPVFLLTVYSWTPILLAAGLASFVRPLRLD